MSDNEASVKKTSWWQGIKAEFKKIIWPDKQTLGKETVAVVIVTTILSLVTMLIDYVVKLGLDKIL
jgi:preprotein translocase subunit SecE